MWRWEGLRLHEHYRFFRDCHQRGNDLHHIFQTIVTLHNHGLAA